MRASTSGWSSASSGRSTAYPTTSGEFELLYQGTLAQQGGQAADRLGGQLGSARQLPGVRQPGAPSSSVPGAGPGVGTTLGPRGGVVGVMSKSKGQAIKTYQGRSRYEEWQFIYTNIRPKLPLPPGVKPGAPGAPGPGVPGGRPRSPFPGAGSGSGRPIGTPPPPR